jgi:hypothetical protein
MKKHVSIMALVLLGVAGSAAAAGPYDVSVDAPAGKAKERAVARISLRPKGPFHVNVDYPTKLSMKAPDGVKIEREVQRGAEALKFEKGALDFEVGFTADGAGTKSFTGELKFAVCTDTECKPTTEKLAFDVQVK